MTEHELKYEKFAQLLGIKALQALIPISQERITQALAEGDEHLNKWGNAPVEFDGVEYWVR